jgi:hypothetical protein
MPRGGRRPGSGRKPKSLEELRLTGGFRPDRHVYLLTSPAPMVPRSMPVPDHALAGLNAHGDSDVLRCGPTDGIFTRPRGRRAIASGRCVDTSRLRACRLDVVREVLSRYYLILTHYADPSFEVTAGYNIFDPFRSAWIQDPKHFDYNRCD